MAMDKFYRLLCVYRCSTIVGNPLNKHVFNKTHVINNGGENPLTRTTVQQISNVY